MLAGVRVNADLANVFPFQFDYASSASPRWVLVAVLVLSESAEFGCSHVSDDQPAATAPSRAATIRPIQSGAVTWGMKNRITFPSCSRRRKQGPAPRARRRGPDVGRRSSPVGLHHERVCHFPLVCGNRTVTAVATVTRQSAVASSGTGGPARRSPRTVPRAIRPWRVDVLAVHNGGRDRQSVSFVLLGHRARTKCRPLYRGRGGGTRCTSASALSS